jgi:hypothetical protein
MSHFLKTRPDLQSPLQFLLYTGIFIFTFFIRLLWLADG